MRRYLFLCLLSPLLFSGCVGFIQGNKLADKISAAQVDLRLSETPTKSISLQYTGCGGFIIQQGDDIVITDPFYSNISPFITMFVNRIKSDKRYIDELYAPILDGLSDSSGKVKAIMVTHAHYDHLMDVPYLYHQKLDPDSLLIIASKTAGHTLRGAAQTYNDELEPKVFIEANQYAEEKGVEGKWIYTHNKHVRIKPIIGEHAPHLGKIKLYKGTLDEDRTKYPKSAGKWVEGQTFTYLVDFLDETGKPDFRIFVQTSASNPDKGIPTITDGKAVDLAIICVASYQNVEDYPSVLLKELQPKHVILAHWENFFKPIKKLKKNPRAVPLTKVPRFVKSMDSLLLQQPELVPSGYTLPNIETQIRIEY